LHRRVPRQVTHAPRGLAGRGTEQDSLSRPACELDEHALGMRLARAGKPGEQDERTRTDELDDAPLLVRDFDLGPLRALEELGLGGRAAAERTAETALHLPQLTPVHALLLEYHLARKEQRPS